MESAFAWLSQLVEAFYKFIPRLVVIRATHGGVKWICGKKVKPLGPGLHFYWPIVSDLEVLVTARQTLRISDQVLTTKDGRRVVMQVVVVYRIKNAELAIGRRNWDVDTTVADVTQSAVVRVVATHTFEEVMNGITDSSIIDTLTRETRKELRQFGVRVDCCKVADFALCTVIKLMTTTPSGQGQPTFRMYA